MACIWNCSEGEPPIFDCSSIPCCAVSYLKKNSGASPSALENLLRRLQRRARSPWGLLRGGYVRAPSARVVVVLPDGPARLRRRARPFRRAKLVLDDPRRVGLLAVGGRAERGRGGVGGGQAEGAAGDGLGRPGFELPEDGVAVDLTRAEILRRTTAGSVSDWRT